jgi:hypothetical protein
MKISPLLLGLSLAVTGSLVTVAQDTSAAKAPEVLQINREWVKPGKAGAAHDKTEAAFVSAFTRAKWPTHYVAYCSLSGKSRCLYFSRFDNFEAWEKDNKMMERNAALSAEVDRLAAADGELLDSLDQAVFTYNEDLSYHSHKPSGQMRYMEISIFEVKPGHRHEWHELVKMVKDAHDKAGTSAHWGAYDIAFGRDDGTYLILSGDTSMSDIDKGIAESKKWVEAIGGEEGMKKFDELYGSAVASSRSELFAVNPAQSYVDEEWIKSDPGFWKPKAAEAAAKTAKPATSASAKPAAAPAAPKPASR